MKQRIANGKPESLSLDRYSSTLSSLTRINIFDKIAANPPVVIPEAKIPLIASGAAFRISGINSTPKPSDRLTASTKVAYRLIS